VHKKGEDSLGERSSTKKCLRQECEKVPEPGMEYCWTHGRSFLSPDEKDHYFSNIQPLPKRPKLPKTFSNTRNFLCKWCHEPFESAYRSSKYCDRHRDPRKRDPSDRFLDGRKVLCTRCNRIETPDGVCFLCQHNIRFLKD
jgi:hypothetical protein